MIHELKTVQRDGRYYHRCLRCGSKKVTIKPGWVGDCFGKPLLGDIIAGWFTRLGLHSRPGCGCDKRKSWINRKAAWFRNLFRRS